MILPLKLAWTVQLPLKQKLSIGGVFCVGIICVIVAIVRVVQVSLAAKKDAPTIPWLAIWGVIEREIRTFHCDNKYNHLHQSNHFHANKHLADCFLPPLQRS